MLRIAGFSSVKRIVPATQPAMDKLEYILSIRIDGRRQYEKITGIVARLFYYVLEEKIGAIDIFMRTSLVPCHFSAVKAD